MIKGIGIDIIEVKRIKKLMEEYGDRFFQRILTENEINYSEIIEEIDDSTEISGQVVCFTGALSIDRQTATRIATRAGATVIDGVNKKLTLLVVGLQTQTIGDKSSKHIKAEDLYCKF